MKSFYSYLIASFSIFAFASVANAGELASNDPNIIDICQCVENPQAAQSSNCQQLFAQMSPEQAPAHTAGMTAAHMVPQGMAPAPAAVPQQRAPASN